MEKYSITINVPLFKKLRDIIFFCGTITLWAISWDILRGPRLIWRRGQFRGQKSRGPLKMSREMAHKVIVPQKKIRSQSFLNSGTLVILCIWVLLCTVVCCCLLLGVLVCCCVFLCVRGVRRSPCSCVVWAGIQGEGAGWGGSHSPSHYSVCIHGCLLVGGGVL